MEAFYHRKISWGSTRAKARPEESHLQGIHPIMPQERSGKDPRQMLDRSLGRATEIWADLGRIYTRTSKYLITAGFNTFQGTPLHALFNFWCKALSCGTHHGTSYSFGHSSHVW